MQQKTALITGVIGQDGAYLSEYLLKKGYMIHAASCPCFNLYLYEPHQPTPAPPRRGGAL